MTDEVHATAASRLAPHLAEQAIRRQDHAQRVLRDANQTVERIAQLQFELQECRQRLAATASPPEPQLLRVPNHPHTFTAPPSPGESAASGYQQYRTDDVDSEDGGDLDEAGRRDRLTRLVAELQREKNKLKLYAQWIAPLLPAPLGPRAQTDHSLLP